MAEMDRQLFGATDRENQKLSATARLLLALLWTYADLDDAKAYRKSRGQPIRQAPKVEVRRLEEAASLLGFELETIRRALDRQLGPAGWVLRTKDSRFLALLDREHRDAYLAAKHPFAPVVKRDLGADPGQRSAVDPGQRSADPGQRSGICGMVVREIPDNHPLHPLRVPIGS
ncbi:hypothetical protein [Nannocystis bainbridge]|uniref:Uncharacterized protein n=1 Tax=Nannocystis bainbridge TaxID=2995303 RepID=A0ABT5E0L5_9BACT|nr:hypothetical protein [Nannocystis bainbridge]MDC0719425.1 hypothetical protein [Nannocystis bainbridge]